MGLARALGALISRVQATPPFPMLGSFPEVIGSVLAGVSKSSFFAPGQLDPHAEGLARISAALSWDTSSLVSCHNDPNPRNILFDGERVWLIDWEMAFRNDPLVDLAIVTTELMEAPELEALLLEAAFGRMPNGRLRARLSVIRLLTRLSTDALSSIALLIPYDPPRISALPHPAPPRSAPRWWRGGWRPVAPRLPTPSARCRSQPSSAALRRQGSMKC